MPTTAANPERDARAYLADTAEARRQLFDAWINSAEAAYQASAELQNAAVSSGLSLFDTAATAQRNVLSQWQSAAQQVQQAGLEALRAQFRATSRLIPAA